MVSQESWAEGTISRASLQSLSHFRATTWKPVGPVGVVVDGGGVVVVLGGMDVDVVKIVEDGFEVGEGGFEVDEGIDVPELFTVEV